ncbi:hypothetical protein, partial [Candidatus Avelusimicrobium fimicolum]|uniref:hypothetical protein n=1 Tax=Candidatus Avelusimicrobium fimicolum TaxID=3416216 RepID=UPI003D0BBEEA
YIRVYSALIVKILTKKKKRNNPFKINDGKATTKITLFIRHSRGIGSPQGSGIYCFGREHPRQKQIPDYGTWE